MTVRLYYRIDTFTSLLFPSVLSIWKRRGARSENGWRAEMVMFECED
jgi:hypothetical protein